MVPAAMDGSVGVTTMETKFGAAAVRTVDPLTVPDVAVIVVMPWLRLLARPVELTVAIVVLDELQDAELVRLVVVPFVYVPVAVNC